MLNKSNNNTYDIETMEKKYSIYRLSDLHVLEEHCWSVYHKHWNIITVLASVLFVGFIWFAVNIKSYSMSDITRILVITSAGLIVPIVVLYKRAKDASEKAVALYGLALRRQVKTE